MNAMLQVNQSVLEERKYTKKAMLKEIYRNVFSEDGINLVIDIGSTNTCAAYFTSG